MTPSIPSGCAVDVAGREGVGRPPQDELRACHGGALIHMEGSSHGMVACWSELADPELKLRL
jgi:hypothetical protein